VGAKMMDALMTDELMRAVPMEKMGVKKGDHYLVAQDDRY
jgi:hypothetical protein